LLLFGLFKIGADEIMNIAIFGGSFDPPHVGHEKIALKALKKLDIDKLIVVPTYLNPFKSDSHLDADIRFSLIKRVFENEKKVKVSKYEVKKEQKVPSIETVRYLKKKYDADKIYLIIGADNLKSLHLWYNFEELKDLVKFVVFARNGLGLESEHVDIQPINLNVDVSSTDLRENIDLKQIPKKIRKKVKKIWKID
jgi:nicotinate-nucleotide adenylyltransferase